MSKIIWFFVIICLTACIEPYDLSIKRNLSKIIFVNAFLTDENIEQTITISESIPYNGTAYNEEILDLKVEILVNNQEKILLASKTKGEYTVPSSIKFKEGQTYQLLFEKTDGTKYESTPQKILPVPKIDAIYDDFSRNGLKKEEKKIPGNNFYVDFTDPVTEKNNYYWTWTLWEKQYICATFDVFDYYCKGDCWEVFYNTDVNIFSDVFSNGKKVIGRLTAQIPYYQDQGSLIEIKQHSINEEALRYLKVYREQTQNTGTLADTPPAKLIGNITNINNPKEEIAGFFTVAGTVSVKYWLSRENAIGLAKPIGLLGRIPNTSPLAILVPCILSRNRTPFKPIGWKD